MSNFTENNTKSNQDTKFLFKAEVTIVAVFCFYLVVQYLL
jgi:hypothetical protein